MCLERYRSQTIYTIIGLMTGSLYAITMGPTTLMCPGRHESVHLQHPVFLFTGRRDTGRGWSFEGASD